MLLYTSDSILSSHLDKKLEKLDKSLMYHYNKEYGNTSNCR